MPSYRDNEEKKYFPTMIAALAVIAVAIASFVISILFSTDNQLEPILIGGSDGMVTVDPGEAGIFPTSEPYVIPPENPPL